MVAAWLLLALEFPVTCLEVDHSGVKVSDLVAFQVAYPVVDHSGVVVAWEGKVVVYHYDDFDQMNYDVQLLQQHA